MRKNIFKYTAVSFFVIFCIYVVVIGYNKALDRSKTFVLTTLPIDYMGLFADNVQKVIEHYNSLVSMNFDVYPVSKLNLGDKADISIFKFESDLKIQNLLQIQKKTSKLTNLVWYTDINSNGTDFSFSENLPKKIDFMEIDVQNKMDTTYLSKDVFLGNVILGNLSVKFEPSGENALFIENRFFSKKDYVSVAILRKEGFIYLVFLISEDESMFENEVLLYSLKDIDVTKD